MPYTATMNTPGYLPWDDDPPVFDSASEAWSYLADARREQEDAMFNPEMGDSTVNDAPYTDTVDQLDAYSGAEPTGEGNGTGTVYGWTPGYSGISTGLHYDLGIAYSVTEVEE